MWIPEVSGSQVEEMVSANAQAALHLLCSGSGKEAWEEGAWEGEGPGPL